MHAGKSAPLFLTPGLGKGPLVLLGIGHTDPGTVNHPHLVPLPPLRLPYLLLYLLADLFTDLM